MKKIFTLLLAVTLFAACNDDKDPAYSYEIEWPESDFIELGKTVGYQVLYSGYKEIKVEVPLGWSYNPSAGTLAIGAPKAEDTADYVTTGTVKISANENGNSFTKTMEVSTGIVVDFEDVPQSILAVDKKGANFYSDYSGEQYTEYTDEKSGLYFSVNEGTYDESVDPYIDFMYGGTVFSTFNQDVTTNAWTNQCTINYKNAAGYGGFGSSKVFALVFDSPSISFPEGEEYVIDHLWAMNTVYATLAMEDGNDYARELSYDKKDYFYVTITGTNNAGTKKSVDFYLADFRTADSPGIIKEWTKVDLSELGKVNKLEFSFTSTDYYEYNGKNVPSTPQYFCFDNIAIRK